MLQGTDTAQTLAQTLALTLAHAAAVACYCCLLMLQGTD